MPRVEGDIAASPPTQPPAMPGGKDAAGSQPWKPSMREPPPTLTELIRTNAPDTPPIDQSHPSAAP
eukprot:5759280-Pyramimonas_sp.AAC.1